MKIFLLSYCILIIPHIKCFMKRVSVPLSPMVIPKTFRGKVGTTRRRKEEGYRKELLGQAHKQ